MENVLEMLTYIFGKWPKYLGNGLDGMGNARLKYVLEIWEMAKIFGKWLRCMGHGLRNGLSWKCLKNLTNGLNMFEMTYVFGNWLKCLRNGQNIWEMT